MSLTAVLFLLGRVLFGGYFVFSGFNHFKNSKMMAGYAGSKGVPMPTASVIFSGLLIFVGGLGVILGIYEIWSLWLIVLFLVPVTFSMHQFWNIFRPNGQNGGHG